MLIHAKFGYKQISFFLSVYFWLIFIICLLWTLFSNEDIDHCAFYFQWFFGAVVYFGLHQFYFYSFSNLLKEKHPNIFEKYKIRYSIQKGKIVSPIDFFTKPDKFETLEPKELRAKYKLAIKTCKLSFYSFLLIILLTLIS